MEQNTMEIKYPIGVQDFESLRKDGYLYIDKTELIYKLVKSGRYYFLSRPRRFGKSLLMSTLEAYFKGKKELFKGLAIEQLEKEWTVCPVFHLDLNTGNYNSKEALIERLKRNLDVWEAAYGADSSVTKTELRFERIVEEAYKQTGERVAILIDEYDKPLLQNIGNNALQNELRATLRSFYSVLKTQDRYIRFGLLTGVSKFGKLSVFSDLNNLEDISISRDWATLCGITETEIKAKLMPSISEMARDNNITVEEASARLKKKYDGYHFFQGAEGVYNPYSLLNALKNRTFGSYWFETGTPSFLVSLLQQNDYELNNLGQEEQAGDVLNSIDSVETNPIPLLYQSGYLTIKGYDDEFGNYKLGFPNDEVERGFIRYLLPFYSPKKDKSKSAFFVESFVRDVRKGDVDSFMQRLQTMFADNSYTIQGDKELYFQNTMYVIFKMMGFFVDVERTTSMGRIDLVIKVNEYIYVIEIKLNGTADEALRQIEEKGYAEPYAMDDCKLFKIGVNFDSQIRGIKEWKIIQ